MFVKRPLCRRSNFQIFFRYFSERSQSTLTNESENEETKPKQHMAYRPQVKSIIDPQLTQHLDQRIHPRKHPGANQLKVMSLPPNIADCFYKVIGEHPSKKLTQDAEFLQNYLKARHPPTEQHELKRRIRDIKLEVELKFNVDVSKLNEQQLSSYEKAVERETNKLLRSRVFAWKSLDFDEYRSRMYLFARSAQDYASIRAVMQEIIRRDPDFKPQSFLDFGSGVGTGTWAASNNWKNSIYEYFNVDSSAPMNDLAELILKEGAENKQTSLKNVYFRQFLGAPTTPYDLVLSAYSLIELPNKKTRLETLANLWARCSGYLILIELGTNTGFKLIHEARHFITNLVKEDQSDGYLFAPCPQESLCPKYHDENDKSPCNFEVRYFPLPFFNIPYPRKERFSYIVFKKNGKREDDPCSEWPRLVRETICKTRHTFNRLCTKEGKLQEVVFTPGKHGKQAYKCAKCSKWGDQLPMDLQKVEKND